MLRIKRFSIAMMMTIVFLVALDFGLVKNAYARFSWPFPALLVIILPMANLMLLVLPRLKRSHAGRWFWLGFEVGGAVLILLALYLDLNFKAQFVQPLRWIENLNLVTPHSTATSALVLGFAFVLYTPPQLMIAWFCGWLANLPARRRAASREV